MTQPATVRDPETGEVLQVNEALRPDLEPGQKVTWSPDRWCEACSQARATRLCPICGGATVLKSEVAPVDAVPVTIGAPPPELALPDDPEGEGAELEPFPLPAQSAELEPEEPQHPARPGVRSAMPPRGDRVYTRQREPQETFVRGRHESDQDPEPRTMRDPLPLRDKRKRVPVFNHSPRLGAAPMERQTAPARRPLQRLAAEQEYDERGVPIHRTAAARRVKSIDTHYDELWGKGVIDKAIWTRFAAAAASTGAEPIDAADYADELYKQILVREAQG